MNPLTSTSLHKLVTEMVYPFYEINRDMELPTRDRTENDAEHSWSLALVACAMAPIIDPSLDIGKVASFAITHDLVEVHSGDVSIWHKDEAVHDSKEENEKKALQRITEEHSDLPWVGQTIEEYERKDSDEANYVWAMDKYLAWYMRYTHAKPFFTKKGITKADFDISVQRAYHKAHAHPAVGELFDDLVKEFDNHPEWFVI